MSGVVHRVAVLGEPTALADAVGWYDTVSDGAAVLEPVVLPVEAPPRGWDAYAARGGMGAAPANSQVMVAELLAAADYGAVADAGALVLVAAPPGAGFAPHTWRLRGGGFWLGGRAWARRYAVVAADVPLGTMAHELGHLLFGWADHARRDGLGANCLMGTGGGADPPSPPCPVKRVAAGWARPRPATRATTVADLADGSVLRIGSGDWLVGLGPTGDVLVFDGTALVGRLRAAPDRRVFAAAAPLLTPRNGLR